MIPEELEAKLKEFVEIAEKLPEKYREKCFEVLLDNFLKTGKTSEKEPVTGNDAPPVPTIQKKFIIPIDVRAFLQQYNIPEDNIQKLFIMEGEEIRSVYTIKTTVKSDAQIQLALLTSLENALKQGKFEFGIENVRARCKDRAVYDTINFKTHFKNNKKFFKDLSNDEHVELSPDGKAELADIILEIIQ